MIRLVSDHRDDLVAEHTSAMNRLHRLLRDLIPGGAKTQLSTRQAADLLRRVRPVTATDTARKQLARDLPVGLRALEARTKTLTDQLGTLVAQSGTTLTDIPGAGSIVTAKVIGHTGDIARFPDQHHFASFNGTAPIYASSGDHTRHRLSRCGDRQLNAAIHVIAIYQIAHPGPGQDYYRKKIGRAKTPKGGPAGSETAAFRHRLPTPRQRPEGPNRGCCLTQGRYEVAPPGRSRAVMLPAGSTDRSKDNFRVSRAVGQTQRATPESFSLSCGTHSSCSLWDARD